jgi:ABC-type cobalamin transport system permease subunit
MDNNELMTVFVAVIGSIVVPVTLGFLAGNTYLKNRAKERLAMIEKGIIPEEIEKPERRSNRFPALRNGLLLIGIALGIILGVLMGPVMVVSDFVDITIFTMAVMFGGIAFVVYFFLARSMELKERKQDNDLNAR